MLCLLTLPFLPPFLFFFPSVMHACFHGGRGISLWGSRKDGDADEEATDGSGLITTASASGCGLSPEIWIHSRTRRPRGGKDTGRW